MKISRARFNMILATALAGFPAALAGCKSSEEKKKEKAGTFLHFHLEANADGSPHNVTVPIYRAHPIMVTVEREPVLDEGYLKDAQVVDADIMGGLAIEVKFDDSGTRLLESITVANRGKRLAIVAHWTETRWLAAPLITKRISNGVFIFTPDATREEAERIVRGLKNVVKKLQEPYTF
jgi:preprotein translocase subunit SecD